MTHHPALVAAVAKGLAKICSSVQKTRFRVIPETRLSYRPEMKVQSTSDCRLSAIMGQLMRQKNPRVLEVRSAPWMR